MNQPSVCHAKTDGSATQAGLLHLSIARHKAPSVAGPVAVQICAQRLGHQIKD